MLDSSASFAFFSAALGVLLPPLSAQEEIAPPKPADAIKRLVPLVGNWRGEGKMNEPQGNSTAWKADISFRWSHDGFWLQEDKVISFADDPQGGIAVRGYLGWDSESRRFVTCTASSTGEVGLHEFELLPDGSMVLMGIRHQPMTHAERWTMKVEGDSMTQCIVKLLPDLVLDFSTGTFERIKADGPDLAGIGAFAQPAGAEMQKLNRGAGVYRVEGAMRPMPWAPARKFTGTDTWRPWFAGKVLHGHTEGVAEGRSGKYVSDSFIGWNEERKRFTAIFLSNRGEVGEMDMWPTAAGDAYVRTCAGTATVQRFLLRVDMDGKFRDGVAHTLINTADPFESFTVSYIKK